jgi:hypothetical protein
MEHAAGLTPDRSAGRAEAGQQGEPPLSRQRSFFDGGWSCQGQGPHAPPYLLTTWRHSGLRGNDRYPKGRDAQRLGCAPAQESVARPAGEGAAPKSCPIANDKP